MPFVPVTFDLYRPLKPRLRWAMQCLVSFADHAGRCFPSLRTFAVHAGISKSAAGRDLAELRPRGASPASAAPAASTSTGSPAASCRAGRRAGVPSSGQATQGAASPEADGLARRCPRAWDKRKTREEKPNETRALRAGFAKPGGSYGELPDPADRWQARVRSWIRSGGRFWLADWGPRPNEPGCWVPAGLLQTGS